MDAIPPDLKQITPYIQRGQEVSTVDPVVSYFCKYYAARVAISTGTKSTESQSYLASLLDKLEQEKEQLKDNEFMVNDTVASQHCTTFGMKIFAKADTEDRQGNATKVTARNFIVASQFLQILSSFGELQPDISEKVKYAKWKATDILKAIREGRPPTQAPEATEQPQQDSQPQPEMSARPSVSPQHSSQSKANEVTANEIFNWPSPPSNPGSVSTPVSASAPALAPTSSASTNLINGIQASPAQPMPGSVPFGNRFEDLPSVPRSHVGSAQPQAGYRAPTTQPEFPANPPPSTPSLANTAAGTAAFAPAPASRIPDSLVSNESRPYGELELMVDPGDVRSAQKHARWAISALEYDDVNTAIDNLQKAIKVLMPYRK